MSENGEYVRGRGASLQRMSSPQASLPDHHVCEQARLSRDARFDGLFFTAVTSTRIYCRPVCPAPSPKPSNVRYYANAAAAEADGPNSPLATRPGTRANTWWRAH
jgi:AraC family transcriptional regulator of adaptative response / DNA-3-methyladenine glycosylase II